MALKTADTTLELIKETGIPYLYGITQDPSGNFMCQAGLIIPKQWQNL